MGGDSLFQAKVPSSEPKFLVVDSNTYSAMRQIPRFSEFHNTGEAGLRALWRNDRKDQRFLCFPVAVCPEDRTGPVNTHNLAFCKDAIGLVIRRLPQPLPGRAPSRNMPNWAISDACNDELSAEYAVPAVHRRRTLRLRSSAEQLRRSGQQLAGRGSPGPRHLRSLGTPADGGRGGARFIGRGRRGVPAFLIVHA